MLIGEARTHRVLLVRLDRGDDLHERLLEVARQRNVRCAWICGLGAFEEAELVEYDQARKRYRASQTQRGAMEVLSLQGNLSDKDGAPFLHLHVALSREREDQARRIEALGGHLVRGRVFALELTLECYDDLRLIRLQDDATGLGLWGRCETVEG
jgi:predicted DNA-binding protein with PD1-like motif